MNHQYTDKHLTEYDSTNTDSEDHTYWHDDLLYGHDFYISLIEIFSLRESIFDIECGNGHFRLCQKKFYLNVLASTNLKNAIFRSMMHIRY